MKRQDYISNAELSLVYRTVRTYNQLALKGASREVARIVTYKMAEVLATEVRYPSDGKRAFDFASDIAGWLAANAVSLTVPDRASLVSFYFERLTFNAGCNVGALVSSDSRYRKVFGSSEALEAFVAGRIK